MLFSLPTVLRVLYNSETACQMRQLELPHVSSRGRAIKFSDTCVHMPRKSSVVEPRQSSRRPADEKYKHWVIRVLATNVAFVQ